MYQIVIDTNVIISALRSDTGASFRLFSLIGHRQFDKFELNISVGLALEYEEVLLRYEKDLHLRQGDVSQIVSFLCENSNQRDIFYLWRPLLRDEDDNFLLELAVESNSHFIVTYNEKDFVGLDLFGIKAIRPLEFLRIIGEADERN